MARWYQSHWCVLVVWAAIVIAAATFIACLGCTIEMHLHIKEQHEHREYRMIDIIKGDVDPLADSADMIGDAVREATNGLSE